MHGELQRSNPGRNRSAFLISVCLDRSGEPTCKNLHSWQLHPTDK